MRTTCKLTYNRLLHLFPLRLLHEAPERRVIKVIKGEERERPRESENELEDERPPLATETLVPFPVTELADIFLWRTTVGPLYGCSSSRMHRENMRRREMAEYVKLHKQNLMEI